MDLERWKRLNELFHATLERGPEERDAFLAAACSDESLRDDVRSLVVAHGEADAFERPAYEADPALQPDSRPDSLVGRRLGPYEIGRVLGRGGMGIVYQATDSRLGRPVAVKALSPAFTHDEAYRARLRREARTAAALDHPAIATVFALEEFDTHLFLIREYVEGRTLREDLREGPLPMAALVSVAADIADALAVAHEKGIIHRDLKPENVMRTASGGVKVLDFGLARFVNGDDHGGDRVTVAGALPGTPGYISPEQIRGDPVDFRADQFSFGVLVYELLTGRHPFDATDQMSTVARVLEGRPAPIRAVRADCSVDLERLVERCLAKQPRDRYANTRRIASALRALRDGHPSPVPNVGSPSPVAGRDAPGRSPLWWWWFHQVTVSVVYGLTVYPIWRARDWLPSRWGVAAFVAVVAVVGVSVTLRLHLCFSSRVYPAELQRQRRLVASWTRVTDPVFGLLVLLAAVSIADAHPEWGGLLITIAAASGVSAFLIEPATTRAAFPDHPP